MRRINRKTDVFASISCQIILQIAYIKQLVIYTVLSNSIVTPIADKWIIKLDPQVFFSITFCT